MPSRLKPTGLALATTTLLSLSPFTLYPLPFPTLAQVLEVLTARDRLQACLEELAKAGYLPTHWR